MKGNSIFDKIFPRKYNFYAMLQEQSMTNYKAVHSMEKWIKDRGAADYNEIFINKDEADRVRFRLEDDLVEAFATPFDRQDIYTISVEMNKILDCCKSLVKTIKALGIEPDATIIGMSSLLSKAAYELTEAMSILEKEPAKSQSKIESIRLSQNSMEEIYISGLTGLFAHNDAITILRYREIYNYLKEAAMFLGYTVDIYHRICVRMI